MLRCVVLAACLAIPLSGGSAALVPRDAASSVVAAGRVVDGEFWSPSLGVRKRYLVYLPPSYAANDARRYPVAYYLHGLDGDETDWARQGRIGATLDSLIAAGMPELLVVLPDGDDGWYTTWNTLGDYAGCRAAPPEGEPAATYCVPWPHYDDYVARDLVAHVDSTWRTQAVRARRGIAGLSMGGYGAVTLALRYPRVFAAAASHSGTLAPLHLRGAPTDGAPQRYAADEATLARAWGATWPRIRPAFGRDTMGWWARDPARLAERALQEGAPLPQLFLDVGTGDRLAHQTRDFRAALQRLGIPHRYAEWPGGHDWRYWALHARESLVWLAEAIGDR